MNFVLCNFLSFGNLFHLPPFALSAQARWEKANAKLEEDRAAFDQKNKKLEGIMKQFQGLG